MNSEKIKRVIFAVIAIPILVLILIFGNKYIIDILCSIVAILGLREFFEVTKKIAKPIKWIGYIACLSIALIHVVPTYLLAVLTFAIPLAVLILMTQVVVTEMKYNLMDVAITMFGIFYVVGLIIFIPLLYGIEDGKFLIWYIFISAWGTDTFAYFIGCKFGKHKYTKISPKKSIEGCIAGTIGGTALIVLYTWFVNMYSGLEISYLYIALIGLALSIFGQLGDLAASSIKRYADVKDFSNLIPGHGGALDRLDSIIFIAPIAYVLLTLVI